MTITKTKNKNNLQMITQIIIDKAKIMRHLKQIINKRKK